MIKGINIPFFWRYELKLLILPLIENFIFIFAMKNMIYQKKIVLNVLLFACLGIIDASAQETHFETAKEAVANMRVGWNLGNTLDSNSGDTLYMWIEANKSRTPTTYETAWGQKVTRAPLFKMFKEAGFNAIRVPVTWYPHMEATFNSVRGYMDENNQWALTPWLPSQDGIGTKINAAWMKRVHQVVDYVINQGMYCVLNIHHDTGSSNTAWLVADEEVYALEKERFEAIWTQIAEEFKDYDEHLLFEGYNEMLDKYRSWCFASFDGPGNYNAADAKSAYNAINSYAQSFVDAVRATGGNNAERNLIVSTYGACNGSGSWSTHLKDPLKEMKLPKDDVPNHIIFEVHSYPDISNLSSVKSEINSNISSLKTYLISKGAPVIIGEWGSLDGSDYDTKRENYLAFAKYFMQRTKAAGIGTFFWMGLSDGASRTKPEFNQPDLVDAIIKGYYGEEGYVDAIEDIETEFDDIVDIYNLNGVKILSNTTCKQATSSLPKGIYIINGKKMVIP